MFLRILAKDFKRKRTMNFILLMFITLASMFVASGLSSVLTVANGTDYYLDKAGMGDFCIITIGEDSESHLVEVLSQEEVVKEYRVEPVYYCLDDDIKLENGKDIINKNTTLLQSIDETKIHLFDSENKKLTSVQKGHVYVSGKFMEDNALKVGDIICIQHGDIKLSLILDGKAKDALLGSGFMGNTRYILNDADLQEILKNEDILHDYCGEIAYIDTDNISEMGAATTKISNVAMSGPRSKIKLCYVMDLIIAFVILILSVCLMLVSFVVLKFSINFTIIEEFREIGVMKAIGITNRKIRSLYLIKYLMMAVCGAVIGYFASIPFGDFIMKSVTDNIILGNTLGTLLNLAGAAFVVILIVLFAYTCTGKVNKLTPIDAIRSGQTGERFKKKSVYHISKSHLKPNFYMSVNDVLSSPRRFLTIMISFFLCTLFVLIMVNTTETMKSEKLINTFGSKADLYITDLNETIRDMGSKDINELLKRLDEKEEELKNLGMPAVLFLEAQYKYKVLFEDREYSIVCQQGVNSRAIDYSYSEGSAPQNAEEIAITPIIAQLTGAKIGDTLTIDFGSEKLDCMVTAYFESMNQLGEIILLHEDAPTSMAYCANLMQYKVTFTDQPSKKMIEERKEKLIDYYDNKDIMNATEYCIECVSVVDTMEKVQYMLLGITLVVVLMVTILMERAFIADEKSQIAILKAIGFRNKDIITWHTFRFGIVAFIAAILAAAVSIPATKLCISPIFGMMGSSNISFNIVIWKVFGLYPLLVVAATVIVALLTALYTNNIKSSDTANIE